MALILKQSTAVEVVLGPMLDQADGFTPETGLSIAASDVRIKKHGASWSAKSSGGATHAESGFYTATLSAADTNTLGTLELYVAVAGSRIFATEYMIVPANVYDSLVAGTDLLQADVQQWVGSAPNALSSGRVDSAVGAMTAGIITATVIATDAIDADALAANAVTEIAAGVPTAAGIADAVWDEARAGHVGAGSFGEGVVVNSIATGAITALSIATAAAEKLADIIWRRPYADIRASSFGSAVTFRSPLGMMAKLVNKVAVSAGVFTVYHEDDSTSFGTQNVTTAAGNPIVSLDTNP